jgi:hypothetical protein
MRGKAVMISATAISLLYLVAVWRLAYSLHGVIRDANTPLPHLALLAGGVVLWLAGFVVLGFLIRAVFLRQYSHIATFGVATAICFASPFAARVTLPMVFRLAELRDLERMDVAALRSQAAQLVAENKTKSYPWRWFGGEVPPADVPPNIRRIAARAAYVTASDNGVVLVTDGLGSWRGGYMITPLGSTFVPPQSRRITEGFFYVTAR